MKSFAVFVLAVGLSQTTLAQHQTLACPMICTSEKLV
jgi:hypothetical protein